MPAVNLPCECEMCNLPISKEESKENNGMCAECYLIWLDEDWEDEDDD